MSKSVTAQPSIPGLDDVRFQRERQSRRRATKAREAIKTAPLPEHCCATCRHWSRAAKTDMGECLKARVLTRHRRGSEKGTVLVRPDDDYTLYGEDFEPLRTQEGFRACSQYHDLREES